MAAFVRAIILLAAASALLAQPAQAIPLNPDVPMTIVGVHVSGGTQLGWTPSVHATFYTLYRGSSPDDLQPFATTTQTTFFDAQAPDGTAYYAVALNNGRPASISAVGGEGCIAVYTSPPGAATHLDSCFSP